MNRIHYRIDRPTSATLPSPVMGSAWESDSDADLQDAHCLFTPLHYERNYAYPLIVWLHGPNDDERQVTQVMPLISMRNYAAVGPRGTASTGNKPAIFDWRQTPEHIALAEERVIKAVDAARRWLNIAPHRIFIAGLGSGGTMAWRVALNLPRLFAGVLSIGGAFPAEHRPLAQLESARGLEAFLATGRDSTDYPAAQVCENLRLFHAAGMAVCLRQYPCGNDLTTGMLSDMDRWIMEQFVSPQPAPQDVRESI